MSAGEALERAFAAVAGCSGTIALALAARRPVKRAQIQQLVARLRAAADELEKLL